jgi:hypothetical protein
MGTQPGGKRLGFAVGQQIDGLVAFEIDQEGADTPLTILRKP